MAFKGTTLFETLDILDELRQVMRNPQYGLSYNAQAWRMWATTGEKTPAEIAQAMDRNAQDFRRHMQIVANLRADPEKWGRVKALIIALGGSEQDLDDILTPYMQEVTKLETIAKGTIPEIIAACDKIISDNPLPPRLEPKEAPVIRTRG